jgi:transcription initiation factor TFIIIB Brf1 subunit/transcription initiation factor TFIIB
MSLLTTFKKLQQPTELSLISNTDRCNQCDSADIQETRDSGFLHCMTCGSCIGGVIDTDLNLSRTYDDFGTGIDQTNNVVDPLLPKSSMGSYLVGKGYSSIKRLQRWHKVPAKERSLINVFEIMMIALQGTVYDGKILHDAKMYYYQLHQTTLDNDQNNDNEENKRDVLTRGDNRKGLIAYCVYASCEKNNILISDEDLASLFNITVDVLRNGRKKYNEIVRNRGIHCNTKVFYTITDYTKRYINNLEFTHKEKQLSMIIAKRIIQLELMKNKQPHSAAAGLVYFIITLLKKDYTKAFVSKLTQKSEPTITKVSQLLMSNSKFILPKNMII